MVKALLRYVQASEDFGEFYELAMGFLKRQKISIRRLKQELECSDLETFYNYHKRLERLERRVV